MARKPIADVVMDELIRPFELFRMTMVSSADYGGFGGLGVPPYDLAQGYSLGSTPARSRPRDYENTTWKVLGGGLQTDALTLARFGWLTYSDAIADTARLWTPLTDATTIEWGTTSAAPSVGLAWNLTQVRPRRVVGGSRVFRNAAEHSGTSTSGWGGARSFLRIYRDDGLVIAILTNQRETATGGSRHPVAGLATTIGSLIFANPPPP